MRLLTTSGTVARNAGLEENENFLVYWEKSGWNEELQIPQFTFQVIEKIPQGFFLTNPETLKQWGTPRILDDEGRVTTAEQRREAALQRMGEQGVQVATNVFQSVEKSDED